MAKNRVIGDRNTIPWRLPGEQQMFKSITMGHHIIMGRNTWESINRLLPGRTTVIVTGQPAYRVAGAVVARSLAEAITACGDDEEIFVIGGAQLFVAALPLTDRIYLTTVDATVAGDTVMPEFDLSGWCESSSQVFKADAKNEYDYQFAVYDREPLSPDAGVPPLPVPLPPGEREPDVGR